MLDMHLAKKKVSVKCAGLRSETWSMLSPIKVKTLRGISANHDHEMISRALHVLHVFATSSDWHCTFSQRVLIGH